MARPVKWRRIESIPSALYFVPSKTDNKEVDENVLMVEELEAIRLKDLEGLEQEQCAERMEISRPTFQRILISAREKIADSLVNGKAIRIDGGNYTQNICHISCLECGKSWDESFEKFDSIKQGDSICSKCGSNKIICKHDNDKRERFCERSCRHHRQRRKRDL